MPAEAPMPTAARLVAAISLAILGYVVSDMIRPLMPESTDFGYFNYVNTGLGLLVGWFVMGPRVGRGMTRAINNGLTGAFVLVLCGLFVQACVEMFRLAMRNRYDGPMEAIVAIFEIGAEYGVIMATVPIGIVLVFGAVVAGVLTAGAGRRWR